MTPAKDHAPEPESPEESVAAQVMGDSTESSKPDTSPDEPAERPRPQLPHEGPLRNGEEAY
ncbi:unnamed protein product [marine sediment metagenome]|uniref:Uncharacterized protein n=1 Tax=marine sediment metagenome TaxID=412755 RepID=X0Y4W6_9ZZZZ